jgi:hypothetical protein
MCGMNVGAARALAGRIVRTGDTTVSLSTLLADAACRRQNNLKGGAEGLPG